MTDHKLHTETAGGRYATVESGCVRITCDCGWKGVWMTPTLQDDAGVSTPAKEAAEPMKAFLRANGHPEEDPVDPEEALYEKVVARMKKEGLI